MKYLLGISLAVLVYSAIRIKLLEKQLKQFSASQSYSESYSDDSESYSDDTFTPTYECNCSICGKK